MGFEFLDLSVAMGVAFLSQTDTTSNERYKERQTERELTWVAERRERI